MANGTATLGHSPWFATLNFAYLTMFKKGFGFWVCGGRNGNLKRPSWKAELMTAVGLIDQLFIMPFPKVSSCSSPGGARAGLQRWWSSNLWRFKYLLSSSLPEVPSSTAFQLLESFGSACLTAPGEFLSILSELNFIYKFKNLFFLINSKKVIKNLILES